MKDSQTSKSLFMEAMLSSLFHTALLACVVLTPFATAAEQKQDEKPFAIAIGGLKRDLTDDVKQARLTQAKQQNINVVQGKTREQLSADKSLLFKRKAATQGHEPASYYHSFSIFDAQSFLEEDIDFDGFHRTFSVMFDADVLSDGNHDVGEVYAEMYLSRNGGPWIHYFTTDSFLIYGESTDDEYEVVTTLLDGYLTDHYDVLIDLYEVGYPDVVATLSGNDDNELYALPLESVDYDQYYEEHYESISYESGGSFNAVLISLIALFGVMKYTRRQ